MSVPLVVTEADYAVLETGEASYAAAASADGDYEVPSSGQAPIYDQQAANGTDVPYAAVASAERNYATAMPDRVVPPNLIDGYDMPESLRPPAGALDALQAVGAGATYSEIAPGSGPDPSYETVVPGSGPPGLYSGDHRPFLYARALDNRKPGEEEA